jgi:hypothetical protein
MSPGTENDGCEALRLALAACGIGKITGENRLRILGLLANCWDNLRGSDAHSTFADKLHRAEELAWAPPLLTFRLERHGGTVMGSTRASVHYWSVNVERRTAVIIRDTHRQLRPVARRASFAPLIAKVCEAVVNRFNADFLEWKSDDAAVLQIGEIVGGGNQRTVASRRKRFRKELDEALAPAGWQVTLEGSRTVIKRIERTDAPGD